MKSLENQLDFMDEFLDIYLNRPFKNNTGGMKFNHSFSLYTMLKIINPKLVIESGIWKGHSTYLIEAAVPDAELVSLDLNLAFREHISNRVRYIEKDFNDIDWSTTENKNNSLIFFDDHQNCLERLKEMKWWGFNLAIFEDNYPSGEGDAYSLKQVKEKSGHENIQLSNKYKPKKLKHRAKRYIEEKVLYKYYYRQNMIRKPNSVDLQGLNLNLKNYIELPPVFTTEFNQWDVSWEGNYKKSRDLITEENIDKFLKFKEFKNSAPYDEFDYGYITLVEID